MTINLTETEKQFIRFSKGTYEDNLKLEDVITVFAAKQYLLHVQDVSRQNKINFLIKIYEKLLSAGYILDSETNKVHYVLKRILMLFRNQNEISLEDVIKAIISDINAISIVGLDLPMENELSIEIMLREKIEAQ